MNTADTIFDFTVYTDGSCNNFSPFGEGGAAYVFVDRYGNIEKYWSKSILNTTNNRAELYAILAAINTIPDGYSVLIKTDSKYCIGALDGKHKKTTKANLDIIDKFYIDSQRLEKVCFEWVKGHNGNEYNEMADELAESKHCEVREMFRLPVFDYRNSNTLLCANKDRIDKFRKWIDTAVAKEYRDDVV